MRKALLSIFAVGLTIVTSAQLNMTQLGNLTYNADLNDIWGYVDENNNEYALVGARNGFSIVDVTVPSNPQQIFFEPGPSSTWRDIKTFGDYAYVTTEGGGGLLIVDMTGLPGNTNLPTTLYTGNSYPFQSVHNLYIDENGVLYLFGANYLNGGAIMLDVSGGNAFAPVELGVWDTYYAHDGVVRGDTLWASCINDGIQATVDVSNKNSPTVMGTWSTPHDFSHNNWITGNGNFTFTTDEVSGAFLAAYDVTDLSNVKEVDRIQSNPGSGVIPHNTHFIDDYIVTSYYTDGVTVHDVTYPYNMIETGNFDSSPFSGNGFNGCWGVYPWLPSGNVIASDIEEGLFILGSTYTRGCYLEGTVTDAITTNPIFDATVEILTTSTTENTSGVGFYATGLATAGTYNVLYSAPGYKDSTVTGVALSNGNLVTVDVPLQPLQSFGMSGQVIEASNGDPIQNADVLIQNNDFQYNVTTDVNGNFSINTFFPGNYEVTAGHWMHVTKCFPNELINQTQSVITIELDSGIYDDFTFDFNWTITGNANTGEWERGEPIGTDFNQTGDANPDFDVTDDCSDQAYVTGNGGGGAGNDDIDGGNTIMTSQSVDLTSYVEPYVSYYRWFFNAGGNGFPNDMLEFKINNGSTTVTVETVDANSNNNSSWVFQSYKISDHIAITNDMTFIFESADLPSGHLVEAAVDKFRVTDEGLPPTPAFTSDITGPCEGDSVQFTDLSTGNATAWDWSFPGGNPATSTLQNPVVHYPTAGTYDVMLTAYNTSGSNFIFEEDYIDVCVGVDEVITDLASVSVYPNPFSNQTTVTYELNGKLNSNARIEVYNILGEQINQIAISKAKGEINLAGNMPNGIYILQLVNGNKTATPIKISKTQ